MFYILLFNESNLILIYPALFLQVHGIVDASLIDVLHKEKKIGKTGLLLRALEVLFICCLVLRWWASQSGPSQWPADGQKW